MENQFPQTQHFTHDQFQAVISIIKLISEDPRKAFVIREMLHSLSRGEAPQDGQLEEAYAPLDRTLRQFSTASESSSSRRSSAADTSLEVPWEWAARADRRHSEPVHRFEGKEAARRHSEPVNLMQFNQEPYSPTLSQGRRSSVEEYLEHQRQNAIGQRRGSQQLPDKRNWIPQVSPTQTRSPAISPPPFMTPSNGTTSPSVFNFGQDPVYQGRQTVPSPTNVGRGRGAPMQHSVAVVPPQPHPPVNLPTQSAPAQLTNQQQPVMNFIQKIGFKKFPPGGQYKRVMFSTELLEEQESGGNDLESDEPRDERSPQPGQHEGPKDALNDMVMETTIQFLQDPGIIQQLSERVAKAMTDRAIELEILRDIWTNSEEEVNEKRNFRPVRSVVRRNPFSYGMPPQSLVPYRDAEEAYEKSALRQASEHILTVLNCLLPQRVPKCGHANNVQRLRQRKGTAFFLCVQCGLRWKEIAESRQASIALNSIADFLREMLEKERPDRELLSRQ